MEVLMVLFTSIVLAGLPTWSIVLIIVAASLLAILIVLAILGNKMQKKQEAAEAQKMIGAQTVSMLIIDKKRMKLKDAGFPEIVLEQTPKYLRGSKVPVVKAKVGPQIHTLMCDPKIFDSVPVKKEVKAVINGIYIISVKGLRGPLDTPQEKQGFFKKLVKKAQKTLDESKAADAKSKAKTKK